MYIKRINEWLDKHWLYPRNCPICAETDDWLVLGAVQELDWFTIGSGKIPVTPIMCKACGYMIFFNAIKVGIVKDSGESVP